MQSPLVSRVVAMELATRARPVPGDERVALVADLPVTVTRGCGTVEVRVFGPAATVRLLFDPSELPPADGLSVVRAAVARYRSSLLGSAP
jgi:hypothetical protein